MLGRCPRENEGTFTVSFEKYHLLIKALGFRGSDGSLLAQIHLGPDSSLGIVLKHGGTASPDSCRSARRNGLRLGTITTGVAIEPSRQCFTPNLSNIAPTGKLSPNAAWYLCLFSDVPGFGSVTIITPP